MSEVKFKSIKKKRPIRRRESSSDEETSNKDIEEPETNENLSETLELQKLRKRPHGVNAITLASGKKVSKVDELVHNDPDPFKIKTGGLLTLDKGKPHQFVLYFFIANSFDPRGSRVPLDYSLFIFRFTLSFRELVLGVYHMKYYN